MLSRYWTVSARDSGVTLVELVTIIVIIGILVVVVAPRLLGKQGFESRGFYDQAQSIVRHAQKIAIAQRQSPPKSPLYVVITASQISVCYDAGCTSPVIDPVASTPGAALAVNAPNGVTLGPDTFSFDGSGTPSFAAQRAIYVNSSGGDINRTFYVEAVTGYVHQ